MLIVDDCIVSDHLALECFCCDLAQCKGACCVEGDCGAPLDAEEIPVLERILPAVMPFMTEKGIEVVGREGVASADPDGNPCTTLVNGRECAFAVEENGLILCAIEKAFRAGAVGFRKPVSCHLYPLRIEDFGEFRAVNYHQWDICRCAVRKGREEALPLYKCLKEPLIRKFGEDWYDELCDQCEALLGQS